MRGAVATLKCSVCQHLFRIETKVSIGREDQRRWMVRNTSTGDVLYFSGFESLHKMILEGKVGKADQISRTGQKWTSLDAMGEFMPVFQVVESINSISRPPQQERPRAATVQQFVRSANAPAPAPSPQPPRPEPRAPTPSSPIERVPAAAHRASAVPSVTGPQQAVVSSPPDDDASGRVRLDTRMSGVTGGVDARSDGEQWSLGDFHAVSGKHDAIERSDQFVSPPKKSVAGRILAVVLLLGLVGGAAYAFVFERDRIDALMAGGAVATAPTEGAAESTDKKDDVKNPPRDESPASKAMTQLHEALDGARGAIREREVAFVSEAVGGGQEALHKAVAAGDKRAERHARRSDIKTLIKDAKKAADRGDMEKARELYFDALDVNSRDTDALTGLGWVLVSMGRLESASVQFRRVMAIDSRHEDAYIGLGKAERSKGNLHGALKIYEEYLRKFPNGRKASIARYQRDEIKRSLGE